MTTQSRCSRTSAPPFPATRCTSRGRTSSTGRRRLRPVDPGAARSPGAPRSRPAGRHGLRLDPAGRPGDRALRRARRSRRTRTTSIRENIVKLAIEGGCNAVASTLGVLGAVAAALRPQDPVHREAQPQRVPDAIRTRTTRSCSRGQAGVRHGRGRGRRHDLLRLADESTRQIQEVAARSRRPTSSGMVTVLWCYLRNSALQDANGRGLPRRGRPDRPGQPPRRHDPGRHHQAEAARDTTAATTTLKFGKTRQARLLRADDRPPDRPDPLPGRQLLHGPAPA